jgi:ABC-type bacteriocin/lantibiotic exporter with double-glycine peptidase domain
MIREIYTDFFKKNWKLYLFYLSTIVLVPLRQAAIPHYYGKIVSSLKGKDISKGVRLMGILLAVWVVIQGCELLENYGDKQIWPKFHAYVENTIFGKIIDNYNTSFQELKVGEILTKMIKIPWILDSIQDDFRNFVVDNTLVVASNIGYLLYHSKYLGGVYLLGMIILIGLSYKFNSECKHNLIKAELQYDSNHGLIEDTLYNLISIYTNNQHESEKEKVGKENNKYVKLQTKRQMCNLKYKFWYSLFNILIFLGLNVTALYLYSKGGIGIGGIVAIFILNYNILTSLIIYYNNAKRFIEFNANMIYIKQFFDEFPIPEPLKTKELSEHRDINIQFVDVYYKPPGSKDFVFSGLDIYIPEKQSLIIMGGVGSGKSTFVKLVVRLLKHDSGEILLNGVPIEKFNLNNLRKMIIYVPQSPTLFYRTLWENITYGLREGHTITPEKIYKILEDVGLTDLKNIFKKRMNRNVGKKGSELSGGQRQIVWILRCLIQDCKVVILDEPTSALDETSKEQVKLLIQYMGRNKTVIVITHDKSLLEYMDRLIVLDNGKLIKDEKINNYTSQSSTSFNNNNNNKISEELEETLNK